LFRTVETDTEDTRIDNLVHALVKLEQDDIQVKRGRDLFADFAQEFNAVFLRGNLCGLGANLMSAFIDRRFEDFCLCFKRFCLAQ
jgi:hypothetical protein